MVRIEPVKLFVTHDGGSDLEIENFRFSINNWPRIGEWTLSKLIDESYRVVDNEEIREVIMSATSEVYEDFRDISPQLIDSISERTVDRVVRAASSSPTMISKNDVLIMISSRPGHLFLISRSLDNITDVIEEWRDKMAELSTITRDFGVDLMDVNYGPLLVEEQIDRIDGDRLDESDEFDNEFEETVFQNITDELTLCIEPNVELQFDEEILTDTFEFDALCYPSPNFLMMIEAKDASHDDSDLNKSDLVTRQKEKADLIADKANVDHTECIVITRDLDEQKFNEYSDLADRRDITLIKYADGDFINTLTNMSTFHIARESMGSPADGTFYIPSDLNVDFT